MKRSGFTLLTLFALSLTSCHTFIGLGRDLQTLGTGIENKAYGKDWQKQPSAQPASSTPQSAVPTVPAPQQ